MENELDLTQEVPEGETAVNPGDETTAPEQEVETTEEEDAGDQPQTEEPAPEPEKPTEPEKPVEKKKTSWELRRINELTSQRREAEKRALDAEAELSRLRSGEKPTPAATEEPDTVDVEQIRARARDEIRQEETLRLANERFNADADRTYQKGVELFGEAFADAATSLSAALGDEMMKRPEFLQVIVNELDNGPQVYFELSKNLEEAERILKLPTAKMILEIGRMNDKVAKPVVKPISRAPAPVSPVGGTPKATARLDDDDVPMDQFATLLLTRLAKNA